MKIDLKLPDGGEFEFHFERKPMDKERFEAVCGLLYAVIAALTFLGFLTILLGR